MISIDQAARQIGGAWKMAFNRGDWRRSLDRATEDVFASMAAFILSAPLVALFTISAQRASARIPDFSESLYVTTPLPALIAADLITYALDWAASLILLVMIARSTAAGKQAAELIVGYNWIQPVIAAAQLPAIAIMASTASTALGGLFGLPALVLTLALLWGVIRRGLGARPAPAGAIVVMLILVGAAIDLIGSAAMRALFAT